MFATLSKSPAKLSPFQMSRNFASPSRSISPEQLHSIRQRLVTDTPKLYKENVLSYPDLQPSQEHSFGSSHLGKQSAVEPTPHKDPSFHLQNLSIHDSTFRSNNQESHRPEQVEELPADEPSSLDTKLGDFENPALQKLLARSVNKEQEFGTFVTNIISLSLWNLLSNFVKLFVSQTATEKQLRVQLYKKINRVDWLHNIWTNEYFTYVCDTVTWNRVNCAFHLLICFNLVLSVWRLLSNGRTTDLHLTAKQRELLGLKGGRGHSNHHGSNVSRSSTDMHKPHIIHTRRSTDPQDSRSLPDQQETPFLFKSLKTPNRVKQTETPVLPYAQPKFQQSVQFGGRSSVFGDAQRTGAGYNNNAATNQLRQPTTQFQQQGNKAYVASPRYSYIMNSPSARQL